MSKRPVATLLDDILDAINKIHVYTHGFDLARFRSDDRTVDAVARNLEIVGEAAARLPDDFRAAWPDVPWGRIVALRNRIVHAYFGLDLELVWSIINTDLQSLQSQLMEIRKNLDPT